MIKTRNPLSFRIIIWMATQEALLQDIGLIRYLTAYLIIGLEIQSTQYHCWHYSGSQNGALIDLRAERRPLLVNTQEFNPITGDRVGVDSGQGIVTILEADDR